MNQRRPTIDDIRARIDSGEAADKVDFPDPAAAPLGSDAEAGGAPPTRAELDLEAQRETAVRRAAEARPRGARPPYVMTLLFAILLCGLVAILLYAFGASPR